MKRSRGFTLFEVLVALAIMAVALAALLRAGMLAADHSEGMKLRMLATWEAQNQLVLLQARREWPAVAATEGESDSDGRRLRWEREVSEVPANRRVRRVQLRMLAPGSARYVLAEVTGFVRDPGLAQ